MRSESAILPTTPFDLGVDAAHRFVTVQRRESCSSPTGDEGRLGMTAFLILLLVVILFGAGFALKLLWYVAIAALLLWFIGFIAHGPERRWYRW